MIRTTKEWEALLNLAPRRTFDEETLTEIVRLRRELGQLRDDLATTHKSHGRDDVSWYLQGQVAEAERVGRQINHILEGNSE